MVHSRRRHGLYSEELTPVHEAIRLRLVQLTEEKSNLYKAEILFRVLFRFDHHHGKQNIGRCKYPQEINWGLIENYLSGPLSTSEDILEIVAVARALSDYQHANLVKGYIEGKGSMVEIGAAHGFSNATVHNHTKSHNKTIESYGECPRCRRIGSEYSKTYAKRP